MTLRVLRGLALAALALVAGAARAQEDPPQEPMLRIAAEQHVAPVHAVATTTDGAIIATAGDDKTIRLWRASDGALIDVVRIPIAPGEDGLLYSLAFAPSGKVLLAGGVSGRAWGAQNFVYVIRVDNGQIAGRIPVSGTIKRIAYGAVGDEARIGVALTAEQGGGVQIRDSKAKVLFSDIDLDGRPTWLDFTPSGDLLVAMEGGVLAVYDAANFSKRTHRLTGKAPAIARASPDGSMVAVGYFDRRAVDILRLSDFRTISSLAGKVGVGDPHLNALTWRRSDAGSELWAAGAFADNLGRTIIRRWKSVGAPDRYDDLPVSEDVVTMLETAPDGSIIYAAADPAWGVVEPDMKVRHRGVRQGANFRLVSERLFSVSPDGGAVAFNFEPLGEIGDLVYDISAGVVREADRNAADRIRETWRSAAPPKELKDWRQGDRPTWRGKRLALGLDERSLSADQLGDGFVIGGDRGVYVYDAGGEPVARLRLAASAFGVLGLGPDRFLAALGDGTLRWFRVGAGGIEEEGAFFFARNGRRWVSWLPDGRFDHSSNGGQELAGFHINRSAKEAAEWVEFSQLYRTLYSPEVVRAALLGSPPEPLVAETETLATPKVELTEFCPIINGETGPCAEAQLARRGFTAIEDDASDESGVGARPLPAEAEAVLLRFKVTDAPDGLSKIDVFQNDRTTGANTRGFTAITDAAASEPGELMIERRAPLREGLNALRVRVYAKSGVYGQSTVLELFRPSQGQTARPRLHVLVVGANQYADYFKSLEYARPDASAVANAISAAPPSLYGDMTIHALFDGDATTDRIVAELDQIAGDVGDDDSVVLYFAGHGVQTDDKLYRYVTTDVASNEDLLSRSLDQETLMAALGRIKAQNVLLMLDTCYSGAFPAEAAGTISNETGLMVLSASNTVEEALDGYDGKNGVFAYALLEALSGKAAGPTGVVDATSVGLYIRDVVPALAEEKAHSQRPQLFIARSTAPFPLTEPQK